MKKLFKVTGKKMIPVTAAWPILERISLVRLEEQV